MAEQSGLRDGNTARQIYDYIRVLAAPLMSPLQTCWAGILGKVHMENRRHEAAMEAIQRGRPTSPTARRPLSSS